MRFLLAVILLLFSTPAYADVSQKALDAAYASSVLITSLYVNTGKTTSSDVQLSCSGFVASSIDHIQYILTAGHCLGQNRDNPELKTWPQFVTYFDGDEGTILKEYKSDVLDAALLVVKSHRAHESVYFDAIPRRGDSGVSLSYSGGYEWILVSSMISQGSMSEVGGELTAECLACHPGSSGAAVFSSAGYVLGMIVSGSKLNPGITYLVSSKELVRYLTGQVR